MPVIGPDRLQRHLAAGESARDPNRVHRGLRARVRVPPPRQPPAAGQPPAHHDRVLGRGGEMGAAGVTLAHHPADHRVGMTVHHSPEAVVEVEPAVAVHVPDGRPGRRPGSSARAGGPGRMRRPRRTAPAGRGGRARGPLGRVVQGPLLTLDQREQAPRVKLKAHGCLAGHLSRSGPVPCRSCDRL